MILSCINITKSFSENTVLRDVSFHIEDREKAAIVGVNGAGKTTLLRIIMGEEAADDGQVVLAKGKSIGYLPQNASLSGDKSIYAELLSIKSDLIAMEEKIRAMEEKMKELPEAAVYELTEEYTALTHSFEQKGGYLYKSELVGVLKGLGFTEADFNRPLSTLSGGQKTRVALGRLLLCAPDLILLDEPTNHLDMQSVRWLETYLKNYKGAVLIVSHDRYFLDRLSEKILEIDQTHCTVFHGNYTDYAVQKDKLRLAKLNAYYNQQREIKHQEAVILKLRSFNREKSVKRAESRQKMLDKIEVLEKPTETKADMSLHLEPRIVSGNDVLEVCALSKAFGSHTLFTDLTFSLKRGEHVAIIGENGCGKTTILKILTNMLDADSGSVRLGTNVEIGYYDQEHALLHPENTLFDEISDAYPDLNNTKIRNVLAAFLFTGDDVFKKIEQISGGERGRVSLAKLMLGNANLLILDEPTNHLDIASKEILEDALNSYTGTVLYVSHDRYFINRTAERILEFSDGTLTNYLGDYDYYLEKKEEKAPALSPVKSPMDADTQSKTDWKSQKEEAASKRKKENDLKKCEQRIEELETKKKKLEEEMADPAIATNSVKLQEIANAIGELETALFEEYEKWEKLAQ